MPPSRGTCLHDACDEFGVADGEPVLLELDVVLEARTHVATQFEPPAIHLELVTTKADGSPARVRSKRFELTQQELKQ